MGKRILMGYEGGYGYECRALFIPAPGWEQVGTDAAGLELRLLAHYMALYDQGAYADAVVNGDVHSLNQKAAGLRLRDSAKTLIYALLYGAGDYKLGTIAADDAETKWGLQKTRKEGKDLRGRLMQNLPALAKLTKTVKDKATESGTLRTLNGRILYVRHPHASLNTLLQGGGAVVCKQWMVDVHKKLAIKHGLKAGEEPGDTLPGTDYNQMAWVHDELQIECRPGLGRLIGEASVECIKETGVKLGLRCALDGEFKIGTSWATTH